MAGYREHQLVHWLQVPRDKWLACAKGAPMGLSKDPELSQLLPELRAFIPVAGTGWKKERHVLLEYDKRIAGHEHPEWVALFYVDPGDPPVAIIVEGLRIEPRPGMVLVIEPGTWHEVETSKSKRERIAFAMMVDPPEDADDDCRP